MKTKPLSPTAKLLGDLIKIPSVNPQGSPGTSQTGEQEIATYIADFLKKVGGDVSLKTIELGRPNLIAVFSTSNKRPKRRVLFAPHLDTVSVSNMTVDPFDPLIKGGKLYGRGSSDTKGPMAAMLIALKDFFQRPRQNYNTEFTFAGLMGEEAGNLGAIAHAKTCPKYDLAIVGEPTDLRIVHAHKGTLWLRIITKGRACHASMPQEGENAIDMMSEVLRYLKEDLSNILESKTDRYLRTSTLNISTISGGSKINIVPDCCTLEVDFRLVPAFSHRAFISTLRQALKAIDKTIKIEIIGDCPGLYLDPQHPMISLILPATKGISVAPWFCDASIYAQKKIPAVALGPGSIKQAHTSNEHIRLSALEAGTRCYSKILNLLA
ncbi:MAG: M20 family metallopeptidase [Verrucomicrobiota bacterium]